MYKKRKVRKEVERQLGITPEDRREIRRLRRQRDREMREREREWRRRMRREGRSMNGASFSWDGLDVGGRPDEFSEAAGLGLPEYSLRPRDGVDRAVTVQGDEGLSVNGHKKKGIRNMFKRRRSEPEPVLDGEVQSLQKKKGWFRKKKGRRTEEQARALLVEGSPPPYEDIAGELEEEPLPGTDATPTRGNYV